MSFESPVFSGLYGTAVFEPMVVPDGCVLEFSRYWVCAVDILVVQWRKPRKNLVTDELVFAPTLRGRTRRTPVETRTLGVQTVGQSL